MAGSGVKGRLNFELRQQVLQDFTLLADIYLVLPGLADLAFTDGPVDEPAELTGLELPGRAVFLAFRWAFLQRPARAVGLTALS